MDRAPTLAEFAKGAARNLGFHLVGIADADDTEHLPFLERWLDRGYHGEMAYLARPDAVARRAGPRHSFDDARAVVVVGHAYDAEAASTAEAGTAPDALPPSRGIIARYALGKDYHQVVDAGLRALLASLDAEVRRRGGAPVRGRVFVDAGPLLERDLARRAGLGWFGRNTMLIHPKQGSYFVLGALVLDLALDADPPFDADRCGTCSACLDACPTEALLGRDADGAPVMDARRCISYLTIELRGPIPRELRPAIGNRVFGCDICQEVCPFTRRFGPGSPSDSAYAARAPGELPSGVQREPADVGHPGTDSPALVDLMSMDEATWKSFSRGSPLKRPKRAGFLRNVAVALGNWGAPEAVPVLSKSLSDPSALVRGHAAWALGQIASPDAAAALASAYESEADAWVRKELEAALRTSNPLE